MKVCNNEEMKVIFTMENSLIFSSKFAKKYIEQQQENQGYVSEENCMFLINYVIKCFLKNYGFNFDFLKQILCLNMSQFFIDIIDKCFIAFDLYEDCCIKGIDEEKLLEIKQKIIDYYEQESENKLFKQSNSFEEINKIIKSSLLEKIEKEKQFGIYYFMPCLKTNIIKKIEIDLIKDFSEFNIQSTVKSICEKMHIEHKNKFNFEKNYSVFINRLKGLSLRECDETMTRERARQIIERILKNLENVLVCEDRFSYFYKNYNLEKDDFCYIFEIKDEEYGYLSLKYNKGNK